MNSIKGNIYDYRTKSFNKGTLYFDTHIQVIDLNSIVDSNQYIIPGFVDAHVHIESSMLTPINFANEAIKHGVISAVIDPHEIANVCGVDGIKYMYNEVSKSTMKILVGIPSCVPATSFETAGGRISSADIEELFKSGNYSHLSEMMNYPGVINEDVEVVEKLRIAKKYNKLVDGHAPLLQAEDLKKYINAGIYTDHECTTLNEAIEKIELGMKILIRKSSASDDFLNLYSLVATHTENVMLCSDDCHPDDLSKGYLKRSIMALIEKGYKIEDIIQVASINPVLHYGIPMGLLQVNDHADFLVVDDIETLTGIQVYIDGKESDKFENTSTNNNINNFYNNIITSEDLVVKNTSGNLNVIGLIENSLLTKRLIVDVPESINTIESNTDDDILKIVVLNRYQKAKPSMAFIKGLGIKGGAIATTVAHDSHNIIACGVSDDDIVKAIIRIQKIEGGLVIINDNDVYELPLPVAGLMSNQTCDVVAKKYSQLLEIAKSMGSVIKSPFMTLSFISLLVIPELKIGDKGLFDVTRFQFIDLQN